LCIYIFKKIYENIHILQLHMAKKRSTQKRKKSGLRGTAKKSTKKRKKITPGAWVHGASEPYGKGKYGSGSRFAKCKEKNRDKDNPAGFCAAAGRAAHGKASMQKVAAQGKKKKKRR